LDIERHLMICMRMDVITRVAHVVRVLRYTREGGEVGLVMVLPLLIRVSKAVPKY
jgi:hypothetical protein